MTKHERTRIYTLPKFYLSAQDRGGATTARQFPDREFKPEFSRCLPVIATQPAKEKPDVRKESVSFAGPGLILVRLRGTKHASANLHLPIANAKRFSFTSGAEKLYVRMLAILLWNRYIFLNASYPFSLVRIFNHIKSPPPRDNVPGHLAILPFRSVSFSLTCAHTHTHTHTNTRARTHTHTRTRTLTHTT